MQKTNYAETEIWFNHAEKFHHSQSEGSIYVPSCDWLNVQLISISFMSSYGVVSFITCLQSLRLTPPLRAAETWEGNKTVTTLRMHIIIIFFCIVEPNFSFCIVGLLHYWFPPIELTTHSSLFLLRS